MLSTIIIISLVVTLVFSFIGVKWEENSYKAKPWRNPALEQEEPTPRLKLVATIISLIVGGFVSWLFYWLLS